MLFITASNFHNSSVKSCTIVNGKGGENMVTILQYSECLNYLHPYCMLLLLVLHVDMMLRGSAVIFCLAQLSWHREALWYHCDTNLSSSSVMVMVTQTYF